MMAESSKRYTLDKVQRAKVRERLAAVRAENPDAQPATEHERTNELLGVQLSWPSFRHYWKEAEPVEAEPGELATAYAPSMCVTPVESGGMRLYVDMNLPAMVACRALAAVANVLADYEYTVVPDGEEPPAE